MSLSDERERFCVTLVSRIFKMVSPGLARNRTEMSVGWHLSFLLRIANRPLKVISTPLVQSCSRYVLPRHIIYLPFDHIQVLSGERPWASEPNDIAVTLRVRAKHETAPRPVKVSNVAHWNVIKKCWKFSPELRPLANEVRSSVEKLVRDAYTPPVMLVPGPGMGPSTVLTEVQTQGVLI